MADRRTTRRSPKKGSHVSVRQSSGGAAGAAGANYQARVAAWIAAHILAEEALPLKGIRADPIALQCQTGQPVDDVAVDTRAGGHIFVQAKRDVAFSIVPGSEFRKAFEEFVRQYAASGAQSVGTLPIGRHLDPARDALVLATVRKSSTSKVSALAKVLERLRALPASRDVAAAATSQLQKDTLSKVTAAIRAIWRSHTGRPLTNKQQRELLSMTHILAVEAGPGEAGEGDAIHLLGDRVLERRKEARKAWKTLLATTASYFEDRGGANQRQLQEVLGEYGLRSAPAYRDDIERLRVHSAENLELLEPFGRLDFAGVTVRIDRASTHALRLAANDGSLVLVGDPGAGKSGAIHALSRELLASRRDVVILAADRIASESLPALMHELALDHGLADVLACWLGQAPAYLLIDALDAVRGEPAAKSLRELIQLVSARSPRWRIVASIRRFDLRYSPDLQDLFRRTNPGSGSDTDPEFSGIHHFRVPLFDDTELASVGAQCQQFSDLLGRAPQALRDLLRVPFNLRLVASLLSAGASPDELSPIRTQVALLDRYWMYRVLGGDNQADARETLLRMACERMVSTRRLRIGRSELRDVAASRPLDALLSRQVLAESSDRSTLAFSHHVLFDYACARLLLRGYGRLVSSLEADPAITLVVRPSLVLHFQELWHREDEHQAFWGTALELQGASVPETARLLAPAVALAGSRRLQDFRRLLQALTSESTPEYDHALKVLSHTVGALVTWPPAEPGSFWVDLLQILAASSSLGTSYPTRALLSFLTEREALLDSGQRTLLGEAARNVLDRLWADPRADRYAVVFALQAVCRTSDTNVAASVALLRCALEGTHILAVGDAELSWLAGELPRFFHLDPAFARDVYAAAFANPITSAEPRPLGTSQIMPLVSNRGQDYRMALYQLGEALPRFFEVAPTEATQAVLAAVEAYVRFEGPVDIERQVPETFDFRDRSARIVFDYSSMWDASGVLVSEAHACLPRLAAHLHQLGERNDVSALERMLDVIASENRLAAVWRRLLLLGTAQPVAIGSLLRPLLWALPILTSYDCSAAAGDLMKALYSALDEEERRRIEAAILLIPEHLADRDEAAVAHIRNRLLGCLLPELIVDTRARELREGLEAEGRIPANQPPVTFEDTTTLYSEEDHLARLGVPIADTANARLRDLSKPAETFAATYLNAVPDQEAAELVLADLVALREALGHAAEDGVHEEQVVQALGHLLAAASQLAKSDSISSSEAVRSLVTEVAISGSTHPRPEVTPEQDARFDQFPSWGNPAPRVDAASALVRLACRDATLPSTVLDALQLLARDQVPAVRFQIAVQVHGLWRRNPVAMWTLIDAFLEHETSSAILRGVVSGPLGWLTGRAIGEVSQRLGRLWDRLAGSGVPGPVQESIIELWTSMYVWRNDEPSLVGLRRVIAAYPRTAPGLGRVPFVLRKGLTYGPTDRPDHAADAIRARAFEVFSVFAVRVREVFSSLISSASPPQDDLKASAQILDHMAAEIYIASGAFDDQRQNGTEKKTAAERRRFFDEANAIIEGLSVVPIPRLTHHLLETAESFIAFDPERVFLLVCGTLEAGAASGYQHESLGADLLVRIVERYLASYATLFQRSEACRLKLLKVLDIFVKVGWPAARRLTYRLDDVLR